jgi:hypothetical protein
MSGNAVDVIAIRNRENCLFTTSWHVGLLKLNSSNTFNFLCKGCFLLVSLQIQHGNWRRR